MYGEESAAFLARVSASHFRETSINQGYSGIPWRLWRRANNQGSDRPKEHFHFIYLLFVIIIKTLVGIPWVQKEKSQHRLGVVEEELRLGSKQWRR